MTPPASPGKRGLPLLAAILCAGCAQLHTKTPEGKPVSMDEAQFAGYFEQVFRHHNSVVNQSLYAAPGAGGGPEMAAEKKMRHACQPLNDAAAAAAGGASPDLRTKMQLLDAVPACEAATRELEKRLADGQ